MIKLLHYRSDKPSGPITRRIAIDIETSGLAPDSGGEIILICAVELLNGESFGSHFQSLIQPSRPLIPMVEDLTGISNLTLANAPSFGHIAKDFIDFIADAELVCTDSVFDSVFLNRALTESQLGILEQERFINLWGKLPPEFLEQGSEGIYRYTKISRKQSAKPSEEVARLYWALIDY